MYTIIEKGTEQNYFSEDVRNRLFHEISRLVIESLKEIENPKPMILGAFALGGVPLLDGTKTNIWLEFNAEILPLGMIDCGVHQIVIYSDKIPDFILDRYNEVKNQLDNDNDK